MILSQFRLRSTLRPVAGSATMTFVVTPAVFPAIVFFSAIFAAPAAAFFVVVEAKAVFAPFFVTTVVVVLDALVSLELLWLLV
jgi:hypothetical protein